ncbi:TetR/AcrR family transcriptional regulator [Actinoplanes sp. CA-030573]|uniref:TetR/AcrR family transcriptional regulator n=1 Tax=Actinoplanes sp. CA-030573 TaxID=3239898 RepID=UPI003D8C76D2
MGYVPRAQKTGRPPVTSRAEILAAARKLIDQDGWEKLTVRRLAAELGIGATTLYHHVRDKQDLLILLLNAYAEQLPRPRLPADPRERVIAAATAMHDALAAWPWAAQILTSDGFVGLLDEPSLHLVEAILAGARDAGCTPARSVDVFRSIWYFTVGEILVRSHATGKPRREIDFGRFDPERLPHLADVGGRWRQLATRGIYEEGLRSFVAGLLPE